MNQHVQFLFVPRPYVRVSAQKQKMLLRLVLEREWKINKAAHELCINYAAAKSIISKFRKIKILKQNQPIFCLKRCLYKPIGENKSKFKVISIQRGQTIS